MTLAASDHVWLPPEAESAVPNLLPDATYRVVGTDGSVVLLRVTDGDGQRAYTGEVERVSEAAVREHLEATADPDAGLALRHRLRTVGSGLYWSVRRFLP